MIHLKQRGKDKAKHSSSKEKLRALQNSFIPEDPSLEHSDLYFLRHSDAKRRELILQCLDICLEVRKYSISEEDRVMLDFCEVRNQLPFALELCRIPAQWDDDGETGATEFISDLMAYLQTQCDSSFQLTRDEIVHLHAICMLCLITDDYVLGFEVIDRIIHISGRRPAIEFLCEEVRLVKPGRGHVCTKLKDIVVGESALLSTLRRSQRRAMFTWVTEADVQMVCEAISWVLLDTRSCEETNGWCYAACGDIVSVPKWANLSSKILIEPTRNAYLRNQVDESHAGDFSDLLFLMSVGKAAATSFTAHSTSSDVSTSNSYNRLSDKNNIFDTSARMKSVGQGGMIVSTSGCEDITTEQWAFFMREWRRDPRGIPVCHCVPARPSLQCLTDASKIMQKRVRISLNCAKQVAFSDPPNHMKVVELATKTISMLQECSRMPNLYTFLRDSKNEAKLLRANSLSCLGDHAQALENYEQVCPQIFSGKIIKYPKIGCGRINAFEAAALYGSAVELLALLKPIEAREKAQLLSWCGPIYKTNPDLDSDEERIEDPSVNIKEWHSKAKSLIKAITNSLYKMAIDVHSSSPSTNDGTASPSNSITPDTSDNTNANPSVPLPIVSSQVLHSSTEKSVTPPEIQKEKVVKLVSNKEILEMITK